MLTSTMPETALTLRMLFDHGRRVHGDRPVISVRGGAADEATFSLTAGRIEQLGEGLRSLGIGPGDRVATLLRNHQEHLELYFAVPLVGAVLQTVNIRLSDEQSIHVMREGAPSLVVLDASLAPRLVSLVRDALGSVPIAAVADDRPVYEQVIADHQLLPYEHILAAASGGTWPELDERWASGMCHTTGTTGSPKGVLYSHRSTMLHALTLCGGNVYGLKEADRVALVVPMYHANAWGLPHAAWLSGSALLLPGTDLSGRALVRLIEEQAATVMAAVPSVWQGILEHLDEHGGDVSTLRLAVSGGSALPVSLAGALEDRHGLRLRQGWGLTETSPLLALANPPHDAGASERSWRLRTGRVIPGVRIRVVDDEGAELPSGAEDPGHLEVSGPWVTTSYIGGAGQSSFDGSWFRTGDLGIVDERGFVTITDRVKDLVKSGGEWISSLQLEDHIREHPEVAEAVVVAIPDARWGERPAAAVVRRAGCLVADRDVRRHLEERVPRWWVPDRVLFVDAIPLTSVGKPDKRTLREMLAPSGAADGAATLKEPG